MAKTGIIGHRGAAGLALENSMASVRAALEYPIDAIEIDIRHTRDGKLIVIHDNDTARIAKQKLRIANVSLEELRQLKLHNYQEIPTFEQVMDIVGRRMPLVLDIKDMGCASELLRTIGKHPEARVSFTSLHLSELEQIRTQKPNAELYVRDRKNPFRIIRTARRLGARGINLNKWFMNPLTYFLARKHNLEVRVYTVNNRVVGRLFQILYPGIVLFSDHPERFVAPAPTNRENER